MSIPYCSAKNESELNELGSVPLKQAFREERVETGVQENGLHSEPELVGLAPLWLLLSALGTGSTSMPPPQHGRQGRQGQEERPWCGAIDARQKRKDHATFLGVVIEVADQPPHSTAHNHTGVEPSRAVRGQVSTVKNDAAQDGKHGLAITLPETTYDGLARGQNPLDLHLFRLF
jgi:hypothetical protein